MLTSLPTALVAILLLSGPAFAQQPRPRPSEVCRPTTVTVTSKILSTITVIPHETTCSDIATTSAASSSSDRSIPGSKPHSIVSGSVRSTAPATSGGRYGNSSIGTHGSTKVIPSHSLTTLEVSSSARSTGTGRGHSSRTVSTGSHGSTKVIPSHSLTLTTLEVSSSTRSTGAGRGHSSRTLSTGGSVGSASRSAQSTGFWNSTLAPGSTRMNTTRHISTSLASGFSRTSKIPTVTAHTSSASKNSSSIYLLTSTRISTKKTTTTSATATASSDPDIPFLRGVNLGGWLILESWMTQDLFTGAFENATDEWTFSSIDGAADALQDHWASYITADNIKAVAATGINALRIPVGFWAYDNGGTPYHQGQDDYLDLAIGWARENKMYVWVDCHGSPGSQNGYENSGHQGFPRWQTSDNLNRSISVLKTMAEKYGSLEYADVVVGIELTNEPLLGAPNDFEVTKQWTHAAYKAVKAEVKNPNLVVIMQDAFAGVNKWMVTAKTINADGPKTFGIDTHLYQLYTPWANSLTQDEHIAQACTWNTSLAAASEEMPTYVGEWSAMTEICLHANGSTTPGSICLESGCQCTSDHFSSWNQTLVDIVRQYVEAQLEVFESSSSGYFMWSLKGPGAWGFENGVGNGTIPSSLTDRTTWKYPNQC